MSQILNKLLDVDPNNSEAIKEALSPFFQQLSKHTEANCGLWLKALQNAINRFPKYCMSQRANIETYLAHFLNSTNYFIVVEAAKCAHALQQVRPTQEKAATAKSSWRDQMNTLCSAAHSLIGAMFPNAVDIYQQMGNTQKDQTSVNSPLATALSNLSTATVKAQNNNTLTKQVVLNTRLRNVFIFIQAMLVEVYPVAKPIRPQTILDVIVRALSVTSGKNDNQNVADVVAVKKEALRSLDALVACLGPNLIPFSPLVFRFVMLTLKWCSDNPSEHSNKVRCSAYNSLSLWLSKLQTHRASERTRGWEDELTDHILADITPRKHTVQLKMSSQPTKNLSKKAKRKLANSMLIESNISSHMPGEKNKVVAFPEELNEEIAIAALDCAQIFFTVCGVFLKPTTYKRFQECIVRACYSLHTYSSSLALRLLRVCECARVCAPPAAHAHTQHALQLYSVAANSQHKEISNFCTQSLLNIRLQLHCAPPSLNFAVQVQPEATSKQQNKKRISERNRAALEELLGPDKVPKQAETEEVITIADEPRSKRRKIEEEAKLTDKISLSSDDSGSIEISDESETENVIVQDVEVVIENAENDDVHPDDEIDVEPIVDEVESIHEDSPEIAKTKSVESTDIYNQATQLPKSKRGDDISEDKVDSTQPEFEKIGSKATIYEAETQLAPNTTIYEAATQLPLNISNDDEDETPLSMEVAYDYPNTGSEKVPVLEKLDGDNLPSTNDTDDIQITCGQVVKNSQDVDEAKKSQVDIKEVKVNGVEEDIKELNVNDVKEKPLQNGDVSESVTTVTSKDLNVEDMLADFVDEVNEDPTQATQV